MARAKVRATWILYSPIVCPFRARAASTIFSGFINCTYAKLGDVPLTTSAFDWRAPYATALIAAAVVLACLPLAPREHAVTRAARRAGVPVAEIVRDRRLYPLAVAHSASFGFSVIIGTWAVVLLQHDGLGRRLAGVVGALTLLGGLVTRPLGGRIFQRWGRRASPLLALSMVAGAAGTFLLLLDVSLSIRIVGAAVLGLAAGFPFAPAFSGAQALRPSRLTVQP